jgi:hypothetical protein
MFVPPLDPMTYGGQLKQKKRFSDVNQHYIRNVVVGHDEENRLLTENHVNYSMVPQKVQEARERVGSDKFALIAGIKNGIYEQLKE